MANIKLNKIAVSLKYGQFYTGIWVAFFYFNEKCEVVFKNDIDVYCSEVKKTS